MVASWKWWWTEGDGTDPVDDCVLLFLITAVERFLSGVEGEKFRLAGESVLLARVPCTVPVLEFLNAACLRSRSLFGLDVLASVGMKA